MKESTKNFLIHRLLDIVVVFVVLMVMVYYEGHR